jgi:hypothetical protein
MEGGGGTIGDGGAYDAADGQVQLGLVLRPARDLHAHHTPHVTRHTQMLHHLIKQMRQVRCRHRSKVPIHPIQSIKSLRQMTSVQKTVTNDAHHPDGRAFIHRQKQIIPAEAVHG